MYYERDDRWDLFGMTDREKFKENQVVQGRFHDLVHAQVKEAFLTVEYLLAHSWYFWPLYDEGMNKAYRIIEMAVRLKAEKVEIPLTYTDKNGKTRTRTLDSLIKKVFSDNHHADIRARLDRLRKLRNMDMHPSQNSFMGGLHGSVRNIKTIVNTLNLMFLPEEELKEMETRQVQLEEKLSSFEQKLLILKIPDRRFLIHSIVMTRLNPHTTFIAFEPVMLNAYEKLSNHSYLPPIVIALKDLIIQSDQMIGQDPAGIKITVSVNKDPRNRETHSTFCENLDKLDQTDRSIYHMHVQDESAWALEERMYGGWGKKNKTQKFA